MYKSYPKTSKCWALLHFEGEASILEICPELLAAVCSVQARILRRPQASKAHHGPVQTNDLEVQTSSRTMFSSSFLIIIIR